MKHLTRYLLPHSGKRNSDFPRHRRILRCDSGFLSVLGAVVIKAMATLHPRPYLILIPVRVACPQQARLRIGAQRRGGQQ